MILLGAGSSIPFNVPTMGLFTDLFHEQVNGEKKELLNIIREDAKNYQDTIGINIAYDLETLLSVLTDLSAAKNNKAISAPTASFLINHGLTFQQALERFSKNSNDLLLELRSFIFNKCMKPIEIGKEEGTYSFLDQFYGPLFTAINGHPVSSPQGIINNIYTTNWDICLKTWIQYRNLRVYDGTKIDNQSNSVFRPDAFQMSQAFNIVPLHGKLDLIHYYKIVGGGPIREIRKLSDPLTYFKGQQEKLQNIFMIYPLEAIGYEESIKSPYIELLYEFRKSLLVTKGMVIIGYSLRDPTIGSILEDVIINLIEQRKMQPMSDNLEIRFNEARNNPIKIIVMTRDRKKLMENLQNLKLNNLRSVIIPILVDFPKILNEEPPYINDEFMAMYQDTINKLVGQLIKINFIPEDRFNQIDSVMGDSYGFRLNI